MGTFCPNQLAKAGELAQKNAKDVKLMAETYERNFKHIIVKQATELVEKLNKALAKHGLQMADFEARLKHEREDKLAREAALRELQKKFEEQRKKGDEDMEALRKALEDANRKIKDMSQSALDEAERFRERVEGLEDEVNCKYIVYISAETPYRLVDIYVTAYNLRVELMM